MAVSSSGVSGLFWIQPVTAGNVVIWSAPGVLGDGGAVPGGTPAGASGTIQYNNAGVFGGISGWTTNGTTTITGTGATTQILAADGAVGTPSYSFASDGDTGFYWTVAGSINLAINGAVRWTLGSSFVAGSGGQLIWRSATTPTSGSNDTFIGRFAAASIRFGDVDAAAPVAQTLRVQSVIAGTTDTAGAAWTRVGSLSTGAGASGDIVWQVGGTGAASTTQNAALTALTIKGATATTGNPNIVLGNAATATNATDGFLHIASGAGTPTGVPTLFTGRVPIYIDTTNSQLWLYLGGAWKQPKTPAGAAVVTWQ